MQQWDILVKINKRSEDSCIGLGVFFCCFVFFFQVKVLKFSNNYRFININAFMNAVRYLSSF